MKLHIVSDTSNLQMEGVTYVTDVQVIADSLDIILFFKQFNQIDCRVSEEIVKDKSLKFQTYIMKLNYF